MPQDAMGPVLLNRISVFNNDIEKHEKTIYLIQPATEPPEIIIEKYRKVMAPGAQETFSLSIKTKNENTAAELMTTLYDASLDKLQKMEWNRPEERGEDVRLRTSWGYALSTVTAGGDYGQSEPEFLAISNGAVGTSRIKAGGQRRQALP